MLFLSHMLVSATATSMILGTADITLVTIGGICGLFPDIDISTSVIGRLLPFISKQFESRFPHRSCTHSLLASAIVSLVVYIPLLFLRNPNLYNVAHAIVIGYTFGWVLDLFSRAGVEAFYPNIVRCVCPGHRDFRIKTGSNAEYFLVMILLAIALITFNVNSKGGFFTQFNRLVASPSGVQQLYEEFGATNAIKVKLKGTFSKGKMKADGEYTILADVGDGFIVKSQTNKIYKVGTSPNSQILIREIVADKGEIIINDIDVVLFDDQSVTAKLKAYKEKSAFVSGELTIDDPESVKIMRDPYQYHTIKLSSKQVSLDFAPIANVMSSLKNQYATGEVEVRTINYAKTPTKASF